MPMSTFLTLILTLTVALADQNNGNGGNNGNGNNGNGNNGNNPTRRDICIVGGGASGMATAVFAKDNGYSVVVLEKNSFVGGHCKTTKFVPTTPGGVNYVDLGVQLFPDTRVARLAGLYPFTINTTDIVRRFVGNDSVLFNDFTGGGASPSYLVDLTIPTYLTLPAGPPSVDFQLAFARLFQLLVSNYPWLSSPGYPDPLPAELLVTFDQWVVTNNFGVLVPFFNQLADNLGAYRDLRAVYALGILSPVVLNFFITPNTAFHVKGGCSEIYEGMAHFLGFDNVVLNSVVTQVKRTNGKVQIRGKNSHTNINFRYICDDLIIAFAQTKDSLSAFDLDNQEQQIFKQVETRNYWWGTADLTGTKTVGPFSMTIGNISDPFLTAPYPSLILVNRGSGNQRPAAWYAASGTQTLTKSAIQNVIQNNFNTMVGLGLLDSVAVTDFNFHVYQPFVNNITALAQSPTLYTKIAHLQGQRHTYYVGSLVGYAGTYVVWENAYKLVQTYFP